MLLSNPKKRRESILYHANTNYIFRIAGIDEDGLFDGDYKMYKENGELFRHLTYKHGEIVEKHYIEPNTYRDDINTVSTFNWRREKRVTCPHCGVVGSKAIMTRWHFDKCPKKGESKNERSTDGSNNFNDYTRSS